MAMRWILLLGVLLVLPGCKTTGNRSSSTTSGDDPSASSCQDSCGGSMASPDLLGCVTSCNTWKSNKMTTKAGQSIYPERKKDPGCSLTYEKRNAERVKTGTFFESLAFSFHYTDGIGDGGFYIIGSGLSDLSKIINFTGTEDRKEIGGADEGGVASVIFLRANPQHGGAPSFSAEGIDNVSGETKHLEIVLDKAFSPGEPFAKIESILFQSSPGQKVVHDIQCLP